MNTRSILISVFFEAMLCLTFATAIFIIVLANAGNARKYREDSKSNVTHRVVLGQEVTPHSLPFQAFIEMTEKDGRTTICGGSLITPSTILTAAHCIYDVKTVKVILGAHNRRTEEPCQQRQTILDSNMKLHPGYTPSTPDDDIALLILKKPAKLDKCVQTIDLPTGCKFDKFVGEPGTISGWGKMTDTPYSTSAVLRSVTQPIISNEACGKHYSSTIPDRRMCADGSGGKGSCYGDSGGPLLVHRNDRYTVVGISAFILANGCEKGFPSGFTRVTSFLDWIAENVKN
jgi:secreted trypsin-like serine protease